MPIYKVTTEGDCEGRVMKILGYVDAISAAHAARHFYNSGRKPYYNYCIEEQSNLIEVAGPGSFPKDVVAKIRDNPYGKGWKVTVEKKEDETIDTSKKEKVIEALSLAGLSLDDLVEAGLSKL